MHINTPFVPLVDCDHHAMTALFEYRGSLACYFDIGTIWYFVVLSDFGIGTIWYFVFSDLGIGTLCYFVILKILVVFWYYMLLSDLVVDDTTCIWYFIVLQVLVFAFFWYFMVFSCENYTIARKEMALSVTILELFSVAELGFCGNIWDSCQYRMVETLWN